MPRPLGRVASTRVAPLASISQKSASFRFGIQNGSPCQQGSPGTWSKRVVRSPSVLERTWRSEKEKITSESRATRKSTQHPKRTKNAVPIKRSETIAIRRPKSKRSVAPADAVARSSSLRLRPRPRGPPPDGPRSRGPPPDGIPPARAAPRPRPGASKSATFSFLSNSSPPFRATRRLPF